MTLITLHELADGLESNVLALTLSALSLNLLQRPLRALPPRGRSLTAGLLFGSFAILSLLFPVWEEGTTIFDLKAVPLLMVAPLFGFTAQAIATAMAVAARLALGGAGPASLLVILCSFLFGALVARSMGYSFFHHTPAPRELSRTDVAVLSVLALVATGIGYGDWYMDMARRSDTYAAAFTMLLLSAPVATALFGLIVEGERRRHETGEALEHAYQRLEVIARNLPAVLYQRSYGPDGSMVFRFVSSASREILGIEPEALLQDSRRLLEVIHPEDAAKVQEAMCIAGQRSPAPLVTEYRIIRPDGQTRWIQARSQLQHGPGAQDVAEGIAFDVTAQKEAEAQATWLREHDAMTGLNNRQALLRVVDERLSETGQGVGLLLLDLDKSALVNELFGVSVGDERLVEVARRLKAAAPGGAFLARTGGDSFALLVTPVPGVEVLVNQAAHLIGAVGRPMESAGQALPMSARAGIALAPADGADAQQLFQAAAIALEATREEGSPSIQLYSTELRNARMEQRSFDEGLARAIDRHELVVVYQPIVTCAERRLVGREALARWTRPGHGPVSPELFVSRAEATGLWSRLDEQILLRACADAMSWGDDSCISVNLSAAWFKIGDVVPLVERALARSGLRPHRLLLEITERVLIEQHDVALATIDRLHALGVRISIDDFGAVYSSLGYLHRLPVDEIKLDRSFIMEVGNKPRAQQVVATLLDLCRTLGIDVVAEGVETEAQRAWLAAHGCPMVQGYLTGRPGPVEPRGTSAA